jgi:NAD+ synthase (glutamine-hydrolysing)
MHKAFGYCRVGAAIPLVRPGAVTANITSMTILAKKAADAGADTLVFPELCVTGYTCGDLFFQQSLLDAAEKGLAGFLKKIWQFDTLFIVGMPLRMDGMLFNCAVACRQGNILGVVPKTHLPNTREFYEHRWFTPASCAQSKTIRVCDEEVPFGTDLVFQSLGFKDCSIGVEICEDLWSPIPPCTRQAQAERPSSAIFLPVTNLSESTNIAATWFFNSQRAVSPHMCMRVPVPASRVRIWFLAGML